MRVNVASASPGPKREFVGRAALKIAGALKDSDAGVRVEAAQILKYLGPKAKGVVPALIQALD
jgi:hypothetical protein